jgi:hypothetical protein
MFKKTLLAVTAVLILSVLIIPRAFAFKGNCTRAGKIIWHCVNNPRKMSNTEFRYLRRQIYNKWYQNPKKYAKDYKKINKIMLKRSSAPGKSLETK